MSAFRSEYGARRKRVWPRVIIGMLVLLIIGIGVSIYWYKSNLAAVNRLASDNQTVVVEEGMSVAQFAGLLHQQGIIRSAYLYELYVRFERDNATMQAGSYLLSKNMSVEQIVDRVTGGEVAVELLTILPAQRLSQIRSYLIDEGYAETVVDDALDPANYQDHPLIATKPAGASLEGYLYPESFQVTPQTPLTTVIESSLNELYEVLTSELKQKLNEQNLNVWEALIMASVVEKEVSNPDDMAKVAQVFLLRRQIGMQLGSDVTAYYGASLAGLPEAVITDTPYNTRIYEGLPPGPISNVSAAALYALANPSDSDYLYFVAGDDGNTYFSHTIEEHEALIAQHCKKLCELP